MTRLNIYFLPFAGGSKVSYRGFVKQAPISLNIIPLELPGRGTRALEDLESDIHKLVDDLFDQIRKDLNKPYAIYGHSMGGILGYLLIKKINNNGWPLPRFLFVTGKKGPSIPFTEILHSLKRADFIIKLNEMGGSSEEVLNNSELMDYFEPIIKSDLKALETYKYRESTPFNVPVTVLMGTKESVTKAEVMSWQKETTERLEVKYFEGNHFFIFNYEKEIMKLISDNFSEASSLTLLHAS